MRLFGDLKRHDMGPRLAEQIDEVLTGAQRVPDREPVGRRLDRAVPARRPGHHLTEAILEHGGEAQVSRDNYVELTAAQRNDVLAFLNNQVLFTVPEEEE